MNINVSTAKDLSNSIAIEDLATFFAGEFVKQCKNYLGKDEIPFLKMSYIRRRKLVSKVLDKITKSNRE